MPLDLERFRAAYDQWVEESLPDYQAGKMEEIVKKYPFIVPDDIPWTPYSGDPSQQTFGLLTSGGLYLKNSQEPFDTVSIHGDTTFREIPKAVRQEEIGIAHRHYDHALALQDYNIVFPAQRLLEMEAEGVIGRFAETCYSFSYVNDVVTLIEKRIPELIARLKDRKTDVLLLVPV